MSLANAALEESEAWLRSWRGMRGVSVVPVQLVCGESVSWIYRRQWVALCGNDGRDGEQWQEHRLVRLVSKCQLELHRRERELSFFTISIIKILLVCFAFLSNVTQNAVLLTACLTLGCI